MGILFGLASAVGFGSADFLARYATRLVGTYRTLLYMQFLGMACLTVYVGVSHETQHTLATASVGVWAWTVGVTTLEVAAVLALYRSFEIGVLSVVSPIAASFGAVTVLLSLLSGEKIDPQQGLGIALAIVGVVLASSMAGERLTVSLRSRRWAVSPGAVMALVAAVGFGFTFWLLGFQVTPHMGSIIPVWVARVLTPGLLFSLASPLRQSVQVPRGPVWWYLIGVGILDTLGFLATTAALHAGPVAIVGVCLSLFSAVTVLLAWIFLREVLSRVQWLGIGTILLGVTLVSAR